MIREDYPKVISFLKEYYEHSFTRDELVDILVDLRMTYELNECENIFKKKGK